MASLSDLNETVAAYKSFAKSGEKTLNDIDDKFPKLFKNIESSAKSFQYMTSIISHTVKRGDYNLKRILTPAVNEIRSLSNDIREVGDEIKTLVQDPTGTLLNGKSLRKGPGE